MANEKKKVTNTSNKNKTTTTKKTIASAKKTTPKKAVAATKKTESKKNTATKVATEKKVPKKKGTSAKKTATVTTKKAAKKVVNNTKNTTKKTIQKKNVKKQVSKRVVEPKKNENKVEAVKEKPKKVEKVESKKTDKKLSLSTSTIYTIVGLAVLTIVIILSIFINPSNGKYSENNTGTTNSGGSSAAGEEIPEDQRKELNSITIDDYLTMLKGDEAKVIYIGRPTCSHCVAQKPIMENIAFEYDVTINYLNTDALDNDGINTLISSNEYFSEGFGTPLTLIVKDDKIIDKAVGETSKTDMVKMFKDNSIIK